MISRKFPARVAVWSLACVAASSVSAQSGTAVLAETVVTASRIPQPITDVVSDVSVIDREQLQQSGLQSLAEVLASLPGVQFYSTGSYRSTSGVFLRGASSSKTVFLVNGMRVGSATSGVFSAENMPLDRIERIEVLRGAAAALYGPDAIGGVVQIITRQPSPDGVQRAVALGAGSDGQSQASLNLQGQSGAWSYSLGASTERASGITSVLPGSSDFNADRDGFHQASADVTLRWQLNAQHALTLNALRSTGKIDYDGTLYMPDWSEVSADANRAVSAVGQTQAGLTWSAQWTPDWLSTLRWSHNQDQSTSRYWYLSDLSLASVGQFDTRRQQLSWQNDIRFGRDTLTLAAERWTDRVESTTAFDVTQRRSQGVLASYATQGEQWDGLFTVRHDRNSQFGTANTWSLSGGYRLHPGWKLVGSLGTTFQAPTFNDLYYPNYGHPELQPQKGHSREVGLKYQQGHTQAEVFVYRNQVNGFIDPSNNKQFSRANLDGLTLSWQQSWGDTALRTSYDYADPVTEPDGQRVARVAHHVWQTRLSQRMGPWKPFAELRLSSDRYDGYSGMMLPGYGVANIGTSLTLDRHWTLQARVDNVTDKAYSLAYGYSIPGRHWLLSLHWAD